MQLILDGVLHHLHQTPELQFVPFCKYLDHLFRLEHIKASQYPLKANYHCKSYQESNTTRMLSPIRGECWLLFKNKDKDSIDFKGPEEDFEAREVKKRGI